MKWWQALLHVAVNASAAAASIYLAGPHVNPYLSAAIGSALAGLSSAEIQGNVEKRQ